MSNIRANNLNSIEQWDTRNGKPTSKDSLYTRHYNQGHLPLFDSRGQYLGRILRKPSEFNTQFCIGAELPLELVESEK